MQNISPIGPQTPEKMKIEISNLNYSCSVCDPMLLFGQEGKAYDMLNPPLELWPYH